MTGEGLKKTAREERGQNGADFLRCDLHLHSCLSPCAADDMTLHNIARMAALCELDIIALTDHNSLKNCPAFFNACEAAGVVPVAGVEINTQEEVHVLCYFSDLEGAMAFDVFLEDHLPEIKNCPDIFGNQLILNEEDGLAGEEGKLLIVATDIGIDSLSAIAYEYDGIAVPAHIDRSSNSVLSNLGFIHEDWPFPAFEVADLTTLPEILPQNPCLTFRRILTNSDAHQLTGIGVAGGTIQLPRPDAGGLVEALRL
jgi:PHP family Zn ribbon phosphoesterase